MTAEAGGSCMALLDFLKEKKNEIQMGIHPLEAESDEFKYLYCFGLATSFCQNEQLYKEVRFIFEIIVDLLGLHENYKTRILEDVEKDFDYRIYQVFEAMDTKEKRYCFFIDLIRMEFMTLWGQEYFQKVMEVYMEIYGIDKEEKDFLQKFWQCAQKHELEQAISLYNEFNKSGYYISFKLLTYMYPTIVLKDSYGSMVIEAGEKLILDKPTSIKGTIQVKNGGALMIQGAAVSLYGNIIIDGGRLEIRKSRIQVKDAEGPYAIDIVNSAVTSIEDTRIIGNYLCGLIKQEGGHLILRNSELRCAGKDRAIAFSGKSMSLLRVIMEDCQAGAVENYGNSRLLAKGCQFVECVAEHGGAIHSDSTEDVRISQCIFKHCRAGFLGAAVYFSYKKYGQFVTDCVLEDCEPEENILYNTYLSRTTM